MEEKKNLLSVVLHLNTTWNTTQESSLWVLPSKESSDAGSKQSASPSSSPQRHSLEHNRCEVQGLWHHRSAWFHAGCKRKKEMPQEICTLLLSFEEHGRFKTVLFLWPNYQSGSLNLCIYQEKENKLQKFTTYPGSHYWRHSAEWHTWYWKIRATSFILLCGLYF